MYDLLVQNASALFAILGAVVGSGFTFLANWFLRGRELKLRLREKVLDRRIEAHEHVTQLVKPMRSMVYLGYSEEEHEPARCPVVLFSREQFKEWYAQHVSVVSWSSTWLSVEVRRELNFFQDYTVNLLPVLEQADDSDLPEIGRLIRYDFISFSQRIEQLAFEFFTTDLDKLKLNDLQEWHKYPEEETLQKLEETDLFKKGDQINSVIGREVI